MKRVATYEQIIRGFRQCGYIDWKGDANALHSKLRGTLDSRAVPPELIQEVYESLLVMQELHDSEEMDEEIEDDQDGDGGVSDDSDSDDISDDSDKDGNDEEIDLEIEIL